MDTLNPDASPRAATVPALAIDLDGTLLHTDLLLESTLALLARQPWLLFALPLWLLRGRAHLKREIASRVELDVGLLPVDERVLALAHAASGQREVVLCTASDERLASAVAERLGGFDLVLASNGKRNLSGRAKAAALVERYGERGFDYAGNAAVDRHVWARARRAIVANGSAALARAAARDCEVESVLPARGGRLRAWLKELRLYQWLKNTLVFVPLLASHRFTDPQLLLQFTLGFLAFGLCASSAYLLNDLLDLDADRHHPRKRTRPFAAGTLPLLHGMLVSPLLMVSGLALALWLSPLFAAVLGCYYLLTLAYSFRLKQRAMVDVVVLAGLYTLRIIAGSTLLAAPPSFWLLAFSMFLFLSLAMVKRYTELLQLSSKGEQRTKGRGYGVEDLQLLASLGAASGYQAVLVLALYINSSASAALYRIPELLWLLCPLLLYWISRIWLVAHRGLMRDDPVIFAATDRISQLVLVLCGVVALGAI